MTSVYQPLDVKINGIIKKKAVQKFTNFKINNPDNIYTHAQCIIDMSEILKNIKKETIINAFNCISIPLTI